MEKTIEERANKYIGHPYEIDESTAITMAREGYISGATEQKAIDDAQIKELKAIVELTASVMGIGTKCFNDVARMDAIIELHEKIIKYYEKAMED